MLYNNVAGRFALFNDNPSDKKQEGGGGGDPTSVGAEQVVMSLLARAGVTPNEVPSEVRNVVKRLAKENFKLREDRRALKDKQIPEGALVLTGDEIALYQSLKELGDPKEVKEKIERVPTLESQIEGFRREGVVRKAAESLNYKASVLTDLITSKGLDVEMREVEVEDKKEMIPHVRTKGDEKASWEALSTYAERDLKDYLPALRNEESNKGGIFYPAQDGTGKAPSSHDVVGQVTSRFVRPSKLNNKE